MNNYQNKREELDLRMIETVATLVECVKEIRENHLPHLQNEIGKINEKLWAGGVTVITILVGILVTLLFK